MTSSHFNAMDKLMKAGIDALERKPEPPRALAQIEVESPSRDERLDRSLLEVPWHIIDSVTIIDQHGRFVAGFRNEDVAALVCHLANNLPPTQATRDL
jgi:hypothetical protein